MNMQTRYHCCAAVQLAGSVDISLYVAIRVRIYSNLQRTSIGPQEVAKKPTYRIIYNFCSVELPSSYPFFKVTRACNHVSQNKHVMLYLILRMGLLATYRKARLWSNHRLN